MYLWTQLQFPYNSIIFYDTVIRTIIQCVKRAMNIIVH